MAGKSHGSASAIMLSHLIANILYLAFDSENIFLGVLQWVFSDLLSISVMKGTFSQQHGS